MANLLLVEDDASVRQIVMLQLSLVGDIGVEIKKKRPQRAPLVAQLTRYANCPQIARLIVLAPRGVDLPKSIGGKPVTMMSLEKLWGIMLP